MAAFSTASSVRSENVAVSSPSLVANETSWMAASTAAREALSGIPPSTIPVRASMNNTQATRTRDGSPRAAEALNLWADPNQNMLSRYPPHLEYSLQKRPDKKHHEAES